MLIGEPVRARYMPASGNMMLVASTVQPLPMSVCVLSLPTLLSCNDAVFATLHNEKMQTNEIIYRMLPFIILCKGIPLYDEKQMMKRK